MFLGHGFCSQETLAIPTGETVESKIVFSMTPQFMEISLKGGRYNNGDANDIRSYIAIPNVKRITAKSTTQISQCS